MVSNKTIYQFLIFAVIGIFNTFLDIAVFSVLILIFNSSDPFVIISLNTISFVIAATNSYFLNKYFTFQSKAKASQKEFGLFFAVSLIGLGINNITLSSIVYIFASIRLDILVGTFSLIPIIGKCFATGGTMISNYIGYKYFVFRANHSSSV